jgi:membrane fusion protein (multidrug efflux system)
LRLQNKKPRAKYAFSQQEKSSFQTSVIKQREGSDKQTDVAAANIKKQKLCSKQRSNLTYTVICSYDGQVSKIDIQPGQLVQPGQSLLHTSIIRRLG